MVTGGGDGNQPDYTCNHMIYEYGFLWKYISLSFDDELHHCTESLTSGHQAFVHRALRF